MKISSIMNTFRRFTCVKRSIQFFLDQDITIDKELIIFNTDDEHPMELDDSLIDKNIKIINNNTNYRTGLPYDNIGDIRQDSLTHASGTHYICWDDDDIFLPWHMRQCVDGFELQQDIWAWKPAVSMFWKIGHAPELACNNMEASILVDLAQLRIAGFRAHQGGGEHLHWMDIFRNHKKFYIENNSIPSYCFNWADQGLMRGHKQSGTIDRPDNFLYHKNNTHDYATSPLKNNIDVSTIYNTHLDTIYNNIGIPYKNNYVIDQVLVNKYCEQYKR